MILVRAELDPGVLPLVLQRRDIPRGVHGIGDGYAGVVLHEAEAERIGKRQRPDDGASLLRGRLAEQQEKHVVAMHQRQRVARGRQKQRGEFEAVPDGVGHAVTAEKFGDGHAACPAAQEGLPFAPAPLAVARGHIPAGQAFQVAFEVSAHFVRRTPDQEMLPDQFPVPCFRNGGESAGVVQIPAEDVQAVRSRRVLKRVAEAEDADPRDHLPDGAEGHGQEIDVDVLGAEVPRQVVRVAPVGGAGDRGDQRPAGRPELVRVRGDEIPRSEFRVSRAQALPLRPVRRRGGQQVVPVPQERDHVRFRPAQDRMAFLKPPRHSAVADFPEPVGRRGGEHERLVQHVQEGMLRNRAGQDGLHERTGTVQVAAVVREKETLEGIHDGAVVGPLVRHVNDAPGRYLVRDALDAGAPGLPGQDRPHDAQRDERVAAEVGQEIPGAGEILFAVGEEFKKADGFRERRVFGRQGPAAFVHQFRERHGREQFKVGRGADGQAERGGAGRVPAHDAQAVAAYPDVGGGPTGEFQPVAVPSVQRPAREDDPARTGGEQGADEPPAVGQVLQGQAQYGSDFPDAAGPDQVLQAILVAMLGIVAEPGDQRMVQEDGRGRDGQLRRVRRQDETHALLAVRIGEGEGLLLQRPAGRLGGLEAQGGLAGRHGHHHAAGVFAGGDLNMRGHAGRDVPHQDVLKIAFRFPNKQRRHGGCILLGADTRTSSSGEFRPPPRASAEFAATR